jgi:hypothetical protein
MDLESRDGITVAELIDMLAQHPADAVVELSIVAPVADGDDDMPWHDEDDESGPGTVWLVGGEDDDVEVFLDAIETDHHDDHDHDHDHDH